MIDLKNHFGGELDYFEQIALGNVPNHSVVNKFGRALIGTSEGVISETVAGYKYITNAEKISCVSDSAEDVNLTGVGAWSVHIYGLNLANQPIDEIVLLNGVTPVLSTLAYHRLFRAHTVKDGNGLVLDGSNTGVLSFTTETSTDLQAKILANVGQTQMAVFTIPAGYKGLLWSKTVSAGKSKHFTFYIKWRNEASELNGSFSIKSTREIFESAFREENKIPSVIPEKTDVVMTAINETSDTLECSASFILELVKMVD